MQFQGKKVLSAANEKKAVPSEKKREGGKGKTVTNCFRRKKKKKKKKGVRKILHLFGERGWSGLAWKKKRKGV